MGATQYTEGRLRRFILLHYRERLLPKLCLPGHASWHPVGMGIPVPGGDGEKGGSIDLLFMSSRADLLLVEIKRRESSERAQQPIEQAYRYWNGLCRYLTPEELRTELAKKWRKKGIWQHVRKPNGDGFVSRLFTKAMEQLFGPRHETLLASALAGIGQGRRMTLIAQNGCLHLKTVDAIRKERQRNPCIWGVQVSFPRGQSAEWQVF